MNFQADPALRECTRILRNVPRTHTMETIFAVADTLQLAKTIVRHGHFLQYLEEINFAFRNAQKYRSATRHPGIRKHAQVMPPCHTTLLELSKLSEEALEEAVRRGMIAPTMSRNDAVALASAASLRHAVQPNREKYYRVAEWRRVGGRMEVPCGDGRIDILTDEEVIEVKHAKQWYVGLGQLRSHWVEYPSRRLRLHLFGWLALRDVPRVVTACNHVNVTVSLAQDPPT